MATELESTEVDLRDLLQPIEAHNRMQRIMGELPSSSPHGTSFRLNVGPLLHNSSPYISIFESAGGVAPNAFAERFAAVPVSKSSPSYHP